MEREGDRREQWHCCGKWVVEMSLDAGHVGCGMEDGGLE